jgi:type IV/VI secretion system ImpK/VasF family protein
MSYQLWQDISFYLNEIDQQKTLFGRSLITPDSIDSIKSKISLSIEQLKNSLELKLGKDHTSTILFAIVASIDEEMQGFDYNHLKVRWAPLQKDFYAAYTSGEVFFKTIDELLDDPSIPSMISEVFYFVMKRGFKGKYRDSKSQLSKYIELLRQKIKVVSLQVADKRSDETTPYLKKQRMGKWSYYGLATAILVFGYLGLSIFSNMEF